MIVDIYRSFYRGRYDTDFQNLINGGQFPSYEVVSRNAVYRYTHRLYTGEYAKNKKLIAHNGINETEIPYRCISLNYFKLGVDKMISLMCGSDLLIKTGDTERDIAVVNLVERTDWFNGIYSAIQKTLIYGDCIVKTYRNGVSATDPYNGYKVVDRSNKDKVIGFVLFEPMVEKGTEEVKYMRVEVHTKGYIFERVYNYIGGYYTAGVLGEPVDYEYKERKIKKAGNIYETGIDNCECVQWLSINKEIDGVYGTSPFMQIMDLVFTLEQRLSSEMWVLDSHEKPMLILGASNFINNEKTGKTELKFLNNKYLVRNGEDDAKPEYVTWDGKLENSKNFRSDLLSYFYELSEMGKTFLSGEYSGNISEETLNNTIKSAIDKANRDLTSIWGEIRKSLYVLCRLNGIEIALEDININFNIGRTDDEKAKAEIAKTLSDSKILSKQTILEKLYGYTKEQAEEELKLIKEESGYDSDGGTSGIVRSEVG